MSLLTNHAGLGLKAEERCHPITGPGSYLRRDQLADYEAAKGIGKRAEERCQPISPLGRRALRFHLKSQSAGPVEVEEMEQ